MEFISLLVNQKTEFGKGIAPNMKCERSVGLEVPSTCTVSFSANGIEVLRSKREKLSVAATFYEHVAVQLSFGWKIHIHCSVRLGHLSVLAKKLLVPLHRLRKTRRNGISQNVVIGHLKILNVFSTSSHQ